MHSNFNEKISNEIHPFVLLKLNLEVLFENFHWVKLLDNYMASIGETT